MSIRRSAALILLFAGVSSSFSTPRAFVSIASRQKHHVARQVPSVLHLDRSYLSDMAPEDPNEMNRGRMPSRKVEEAPANPELGGGTSGFLGSLSSSEPPIDWSQMKGPTGPASNVPQSSWSAPAAAPGVDFSRMAAWSDPATGGSSRAQAPAPFPSPATSSAPAWPSLIPPGGGANSSSGPSQPRRFEEAQVNPDLGRGTSGFLGSLNSSEPPVDWSRMQGSASPNAASTSSGWSNPVPSTGVPLNPSAPAWSPAPAQAMPGPAWSPAPAQAMPNPAWSQSSPAPAPAGPWIPQSSSIPVRLPTPVAGGPTPAGPWTPPSSSAPITLPPPVVAAPLPAPPRVPPSSSPPIRLPTPVVSGHAPAVPWTPPTSSSRVKPSTPAVPWTPPSPPSTTRPAPVPWTPPSSRPATSPTRIAPSTTTKRVQPPSTSRVSPSSFRSNSGFQRTFGGGHTFADKKKSSQDRSRSGANTGKTGDQRYSQSSPSSWTSQSSNVLGQDAHFDELESPVQLFRSLSNTVSDLSPLLASSILDKVVLDLQQENTKLKYEVEQLRAIEVTGPNGTPICARASFSAMRNVGVPDIWEIPFGDSLKLPMQSWRDIEVFTGGILKTRIVEDELRVTFPRQNERDGPLQKTVQFYFESDGLFMQVLIYGWPQDDWQRSMEMFEGTRGQFNVIADLDRVAQQFPGATISILSVAFEMRTIERAVESLSSKPGDQEKAHKENMGSVYEMVSKIMSDSPNANFGSEAYERGWLVVEALDHLEIDQTDSRFYDTARQLVRLLADSRDEVAFNGAVDQMFLRLHPEKR